MDDEDKELMLEMASQYLNKAQGVCIDKDKQKRCIKKAYKLLEKYLNETK